MNTKINALRQKYTRELAATQDAIRQLSMKCEQLKGALMTLDHIEQETESLQDCLAKEE